MMLFKTNPNAIDTVLLVLRLGLGVVFFPHGAQKMLGWFGGPGFAGTIHFFTTALHVPPAIAVLPILAEFFGPILLIAGALTRLAALAIVVDMLVAVATVHWTNGFFMNWSGQQKGEGFEYHILVFTIGLAIIIAGAGRYSVDAEIER